MSVELKRERIGDHEYACVQLNATESFKLIPKLVRLLGPAIVAFLEYRSSSNSEDMHAQMIKVLLTTIGEKLDNDEFFEIFTRLIMACSRDSVKLTNFDLDFSGKILEAIQVFAFVIKTNFNFFSPLLGMTPEATKQTESKAKQKK